METVQSPAAPSRAGHRPYRLFAFGPLESGASAHLAAAPVTPRRTRNRPATQPLSCCKRPAAPPQSCGRIARVGVYSNWPWRSPALLQPDSAASWYDRPAPGYPGRARRVSATALRCLAALTRHNLTQPLRWSCSSTTLGRWKPTPSCRALALIGLWRLQRAASRPSWRRTQPSRTRWCA
jgi:hypothetical protein